MELAIINGTYRDTKSGTNTQAQTNGTSPPSSLSPLGSGSSHPAALAAAVASRKWHGVVTPSMLCLQQWLAVPLLDIVSLFPCIVYRDSGRARHTQHVGSVLVVSVQVAVCLQGSLYHRGRLDTDCYYMLIFLYTLHSQPTNLSVLNSSVCITLLCLLQRTNADAGDVTVSRYPQTTTAATVAVYMICYCTLFLHANPAFLND